MRLYTALDRHDDREMAARYHPDVHFRDIAFDLRTNQKLPLAANSALACSSPAWWSGGVLAWWRGPNLVIVRARLAADDRHGIRGARPSPGTPD